MPISLGNYDLVFWGEFTLTDGSFWPSRHAVLFSMCLTSFGSTQAPLLWHMSIQEKALDSGVRHGNSITVAGSCTVTTACTVITKAAPPCGPAPVLKDT